MLPGCSVAVSPPCEAVAKLRLDNSFSVAKLVMREVAELQLQQVLDVQ